MKLRPITNAEIEAGKSPKGGFNAKQLRAWGVPWPPKGGWRDRILRFGVPAACRYPPDFVVKADELLPRAALEAIPKALEIPSDAIEIFTDGSCDPNPGPGGWGFAAYRGVEEIHEASGGDVATTNNRMELIAIIRALKWLDQSQPAIVWTDSQYCQQGCVVWRHGWKRKNWTLGPKAALANAELWQMLDSLLDTRIVDVRWTRGHVGTAGNERADELADIGRQSILEDAA